MLRTCDLSGSCGDGDAILSPLDEDSSVESENNVFASSASGSHDCYMSGSANDDEGMRLFHYSNFEEFPEDFFMKILQFFCFFNLKSFLKDFHENYY